MHLETSAVCRVYRLGMTPYSEAWELQERLALQIAQASQPPTLLLLEHPHVFTFGRRGDIQHLLWDEQERTRRGVQVLWVDRGGDVIYHGPGQLVGYPLLPLAPGGLFADMPKDASVDISLYLPKADYVGYLRKLEETLILALARLGVASGQISGKTGVWVQPDARQPPAKLAAIGVKVDAHGVSRHGFAVNVDPDMSFFSGIIACGLIDHPVASLAEIQERSPQMEELENALIAAFEGIFGYQMIEGEPEEIMLEGTGL